MYSEQQQLGWSTGRLSSPCAGQKRVGLEREICPCVSLSFFLFSLFYVFIISILILRFFSTMYTWLKK
jgi:hypothetical protein